MLLHQVARVASIQRLPGLLRFAALLAAATWLCAIAFACVLKLMAGDPIGWDVLVGAAPSPAALLTIPRMTTFLIIDRLIQGREHFALGTVLRRNAYDLFCAVLQATGAKTTLHIAFSLGASLWIASLLPAASPQLRDVPIVVQMPLIYLAGTFFDYWIHRMFHHRLLWPLHALHHSARDLTALTDARNHPLEDVIQTTIATLALASIGFNLIALFITGLIGQVLGDLGHSRIPLPQWLERWAVAGSAVHRVHHALAIEHRGRNFSLVPLWDRLFGTFSLPDDARNLATGIDDPRLDTGQPLLDMVTACEIWLAQWSELAATYRRSVTAMWKPAGRPRKAQRPLWNE